MLNVRGIHHDPERYPKSDNFNPSRYAGQTQLASVYANAGDHTKRDHWGYGVGHRICPGIHVEERALLIAIAKLLWGFSIQRKVCFAGNPIPVDVSPSKAYWVGFLNQCLPFEVDIKPRTEQRWEVILTTAAEAGAGVLSAYG